MVKITTLNELSQLADSQFNQPPPRHGLNLLFWFAQEYKQLNPKSTEYGFHRFYNRIDDDEDDRLLPSYNLPYYEVGNLNTLGAEKLPSYMRAKTKNMDRIIVRLDEGGRIDRVYVTEHEDPKNFDSSRTYRVSLGLLNQISKRGREEFLNNMQQGRRVNAFVVTQQNFTHTQRNTNEQSDNSSWLSWCTIL